MGMFRGRLGKCEVGKGRGEPEWVSQFQPQEGITTPPLPARRKTSV